MRHPIPNTIVLAALLGLVAPATGAAAQEPTRSPAQSRRSVETDADDRPAPRAPAERRPPDRPSSPAGNVPPPPAPLAPPTLPSPSWQPPSPPTLAPVAPPAPAAWQPTPPGHGPQPMIAPGPGPWQTGRYTLVDREVSVLDAEGEPTSLGPLTLLFDSATGEVSHLVREANALAWRVVPRPPHPHQPGAPVTPWSQPPSPALPGSAPFPGGPPTPVPAGVPVAPPVSLPFPSTTAPPPFTPVPGATPPAVTANPLVDPAGFRESVSEADRLRTERRVGEAAFVALATPESVILDCRSREAFARLHVRGAVNLPFPDITADELARLIPSPDTRILLYCNNNFAAAPAAFPEKVARAALNHHSFATLVAYGYRNVFELAPLVDVTSTVIPLEGGDAR